MHTISIVKEVLNKSLSFLHQKRIHLLFKAVTELINGSICSFYGVAIYLPGTTSLKLLNLFKKLFFANFVILLIGFYT